MHLALTAFFPLSPYSIANPEAPLDLRVLGSPNIQDTMVSLARTPSSPAIREFRGIRRILRYFGNLFDSMTPSIERQFARY